MKKALDKKKIIIIALVLVVIVGIIVGLILRNNNIQATTMRILRYEGTVNLQEDGILKTIKENLRLKNGNVIETQAESLVAISLDDAKVVTLDEQSSADFNQSGKYLTLNLQRGSLYFDVQKPLADDENFDIATSTMVVGIRGTSGWVSVEGGVERLILGDGHVHIIGTNPVTGEVKEIDVNPGQRVTVYLYNDRTEDSIMFLVEDITERDLPEFVLEVLRNDMALLDRVCAATGWDKNWILGIAEEEPEEPEEPEITTADPQGDDAPEPDDGESEPVHEHEYVAEVTKAATCSATGTMTYTCDCGDTYTEVIPATGNHTYTSEVTMEPNCVLPGVMTYTCSVCGNSYTEAIAATGVHTFEGGTCQTPMTCTICGAEGPLGEHNFVTCHHPAVTHIEYSYPPQGAKYPTATVVEDHPAYDDIQCEYCGAHPN